MILADSSIWIRHFKKNDPSFAAELKRHFILLHPFVLGELALGGLPLSGSLAEDLQRLPKASHAKDDEVLTLIRSHKLATSGIGWVDAHLIASCLLDKSEIWSLDEAMCRTGERCGLKVFKA